MDVSPEKPKVGICLLIQRERGGKRGNEAERFQSRYRDIEGSQFE